MSEKKLWNNMQFFALINKIYYMLQNGYTITISKNENKETFMALADKGETKETLKIDIILNKYPEVKKYLSKHHDTAFIFYYDSNAKEYVCNIKTGDKVEEINVGASNLIQIFTNLKEIIRKPREEQKDIIKKTLLKDKNIHI